MLGYDSIGQVALGELSGEADTVIFAPPAVAVSLTVSAPVIHCGASVLAGTTGITTTTAAPAVRTGVRIAPPSVAVSVTSGAASVEISATVSAGPLAVTVEALPPRIGGGAVITVPGASVAVSTKEPFVAAGKAQFPPTSVVDVDAAAPGISISATLHPGTVNVTVVPMGVQILGGNYIEANNTITMVTPYGEIASSSVAQFSIGEGEESSRVVKRSPLVIVSLQPPLVTAGKSAFPPTAVVTVASNRPEVDSRSRKLRILAIAA
jgi:hypothetical protein